VGRVEDEAGLLLHAPARALQNVGRKVHDGAARTALRVDVHVASVHEVVRGGSVPGVHVLDDAELAQGVEGAVDAGAMHTRVDLRDLGDDLLGPEVTARGGEDGEDGLARTGHPLAARPEELPDVIDEILHRLVHGVILPVSMPVGRLPAVECELPANGWPLPATRSGAVTGAAVATSLAGHALAGGAIPGVVALTAFTLAVAALTAPLSRRRWTPTRLLGVLVVAQGAFHLAFQHLAGAPDPAGSVRMVAWHVIATAVTCVLVVRAETWWRRVFAGLAPARFAASPLPSRRRTPPVGRPPFPQPVCLDEAASRRGPPLSITV
jgi:hypothetical protein